MKKEVKKYTVIQSLTESEIKSIGTSRWVYKKRWMLSAIGAVILAGLLILVSWAGEDKSLSKYWVGTVLGFGSVILGFICWYVAMARAGNQFWKEHKDKSEPIDLTKVD